MSNDTSLTPGRRSSLVGRAVSTCLTLAGAGADVVVADIDVPGAQMTAA